MAAFGSPCLIPPPPPVDVIVENVELAPLFPVPQAAEGLAAIPAPPAPTVIG